MKIIKFSIILKLILSLDSSIANDFSPEFSFDKKPTGFLQLQDCHNGRVDDPKYLSGSKPDNLDIYDKAIKLCKDYSEKRAKGEWWEHKNDILKDVKASDVYEQAMKICGAGDYRRYASTVWGMHIYSNLTLADNHDFKTLTSIALHHIAGDMLHIVQLAKDPNYRKKVASAMEQEYIEIWAENNLRNKTTKAMNKAIIPKMPAEYCNNDIDMCDAFIKMIGFFKSWNELVMKEDNIRNFYFSITDAYNKGRGGLPSESNYYSYGPYDQISLAKYRKQRKLSLFWHPTYFTIYDTPTYKKESEREWKRGYVPLTKDELDKIETQELMKNVIKCRTDTNLYNDTHENINDMHKWIEKVTLQDINSQKDKTLNVYFRSYNKDKPDSLITLGISYEIGHRIQKDYIKASYWFLVASKYGERGGIKRIKEMFSKGKLKK